MRPRALLAGPPVLLYHGLAEDDGRATDKYVLPRRAFAAQLRHLRRRACPVLPLAGLWEREEPQPRRRPAVALTFDDGRASDYELAFPLLSELDLPAEFFINPRTVGRPGYLTWAQVREMRRGGMSFQSHSHDHVDLTRLTPPVLADQLRESRREIEDRTGAPVQFLAAPYGLVTRRVVDAAVSEGYRAVATSRSWPARPGGRTVDRIAVYRQTSLAQFRRLIHRDAPTYAARSLRAAVLHVPRSLLLRWRPGALGVQVLERHA